MRAPLPVTLVPVGPVTVIVVAQPFDVVSYACEPLTKNSARVPVELMYTKSPFDGPLVSPQSICALKSATLLSGLPLSDVYRCATVFSRKPTPVNDLKPTAPL